MKEFRYPQPADFSRLCPRPAAATAGLKKQVTEILTAVQNGGDRALRDLTERFDRCRLEKLQVSREEMENAAQFVPPDLKGAIAVARRNVETFHQAQREPELDVETQPGVQCRRRNLPIGRVGLYIPGGSAPLISTVIMLAVPARLAGCGEVLICTPPAADGSINHTLLYTLSLFGLEKVFKVGGAQAIAAMAYGTESIGAVDKIFGPGNSYVTIAKQLVWHDGVAIDIPAGPSEVLIIADQSADAAFIAADLLSQAEHGPDSQVILVTNHAELLGQVRKEVTEQISRLERRELAAQSLEHGALILTHDLTEALQFSNSYAPEHLILAVADPEVWAAGVSNAGSVFLGHYSPEAVGDYAAGTNHTLPTGGWARSLSGVSLDSFLKKVSFQQLSAAGLRDLGPVVERLALAEGLQGHREAVAVRLRRLENV